MKMLKCIFVDFSPAHIPLPQDCLPSFPANHNKQLRCSVGLAVKAGLGHFAFLLVLFILHLGQFFNVSFDPLFELLGVS